MTTSFTRRRLYVYILLSNDSLSCAVRQVQSASANVCVCGQTVPGFADGFCAGVSWIMVVR